MTAADRYAALIKNFSPDGTLMHIRQLLPRAAHLWPERTMIICEEDCITYKELHTKAQHFAHTLRDQGVTHGERVIIYYENSIEFFIAYFAVWEAGGIVAPLNVFLQEQELHRIIEDAQPKVIIVSPTLKDKLPQDNASLPPIIADVQRSQEPTSERLDGEQPTPDSDGDDIAAILYTSGTTGFPKGVMLSSKNIVTNTLQGASSFEVASNERVFCPMPLFHSLPQNICVWAIMTVGASAIIVPKIDRRSLLKGLTHKPTIIVAVPALYGLFCLLRTIKFGAIKLFVTGGDALPDKIRSAFKLVYGRKLCNGYGLTETSPFVSVDFEDYTKPTGCVGRPLPGISYAIRNEEGTELQDGEIGVLWLAGDNIMKGYYNAQEATDEVLKDGWFNTGDLGYIDTNGAIVLVGRERDLISNKGLKIYPQEVENAIISHPSVLQVGVIGVMQDGEELPVAYIASKIPHEQYDALTRELRDLCQRSLSPYKVPRQWHIEPELPITATGKVDKKSLRARTSHN